MSEEQEEYVTDALNMGIDLSETKKVIQEISGFTPIFDAVVEKYHDETRAAVHGAMWRFCQMEDRVCKASLSTIGDLLGVSSATVMRHAEVLCEDGYFVDLTPELKNKPHIYADTGKVVMKSRLSAGVSERNVGISQRNATVSQSQLNKVLKKVFEDGSNEPKTTFPLDWQVSHNLPIERQDEFESKAKDVSNLIEFQCAGAGELAYAFMTARKILIPEGKVKGNRKAAREMVEMKVKPEHIKRAVEQLLEKKMTVVDLFSISKTAIDLANKPQEVVEKYRLL